MTYERPEALEVGSVEDVVLGQTKQVGNIDFQQLPKSADTQVAEVVE